MTEATIAKVGTVIARTSVTDDYGVCAVRYWDYTAVEDGARLRKYVEDLVAVAEQIGIEDPMGHYSAYIALPKADSPIECEWVERAAGTFASDDGWDIEYSM